MSKKKLMIIGLVLFLLIGGTVGYFVYTSMNQGDRYDNEFAAKKGLMPGKTRAEIQALLDQQIGEGMMNIRINSDIVLSNGNAMGLIALENIEQNHCSYMVEIRLKDENTVLCKTGVVQPGYYIDNVRFNHDTVLKKGKYLAIATFTAYYPDTNKDIRGSANVEMNITVEN